MQRSLSALAVMVCVTAPAWANGMLVPKDIRLQPLGVKYQRVHVTIEDQAATTKVEQVFFNSTSRDLEATYIFPLPAGAAVKEFALWIGGKRTKAELIEAGKARRIYTDIVRRAKDPGLLEYMGNNLLRVRVYPVPKQGEQKIELSYTQLLTVDSGVVNYRYPLRTGRKVSQTLKDFTLGVSLKSRVAIKSVYCPSHKNVAIRRPDDHHATVGFEQTRYMLDRDFDLYYTVSAEDVGLHLIARRPTGTNGYFMLLVSPRAELGKLQLVPQDVVFVVDTSGSMAGNKIAQVRKAMSYCVKTLRAQDRFALVRFATDVEVYRKDLAPADPQNVQAADGWIKKLEAGGGTNIDDALKAALAIQRDPSRPFTVVFLTDGLPTIGQTDPKAILANVKSRNTAGTRMFVFGVGDDVNTHLLDQLADLTRATSQYVRPKETIEQKVSSFFGKVRHPVLVNLALDVTGVRVVDMYPIKLPDLFHGSQLVVLGRYDGAGRATIKLTGRVGKHQCVFAYETAFPQQETRHEFVETLWARRKVGYLLDHIRLHGEKKELVDQIKALGKKYGIASPYMSYLVVEDQPPRPTPVIVRSGRPRRRYLMADRTSGGGKGGVVRARGARRNGRAAAAYPEAKQWAGLAPSKRKDKAADMAVRTGPAPAGEPTAAMREESGRSAVELAQQLRQLKDASQLRGRTARIVKRVGGKTFVWWHGIWVDRNYRDTCKQVRIQYLGETYLKVLAARPAWKSILALGENLVVVCPNGTALVIGGKEDKPLSDAEVAALFVSTAATRK